MNANALPRCEWIRQLDERTGREVWQITSGPAASEAVYFEAQGFTADERYLVFRSQRTGRSELHRCDLRTGEIDALSDGAALTGHSICMHPDGRRAFYLTAHEMHAVDVAGGGHEIVADVRGQLPGRLVPYPISFSADGRRAALAVVEAQAEPRTTLALLDVGTGRMRPVLEWPEGFSHPMICPADADLVSFVPHGNACWQMDRPDEQRTRTWLADARTGEARPFITPVRYRVVTHESWSPDGRRMFFFDKTYPHWCPVSICSAGLDGGDWEAHFTSYRHYLGHGCCSPDGRHFLSDCQRKGDSPLLRIDLAAGTHEVLCWPDATQDGGHAACAHVHPSFSPTGRYVCYTSDKTGTPQVHVVPL